MELLDIKRRFGIIGNDPRLNRAIQVAQQIADTDVSVLVTGESGVGKEHIPKIIHNLSHRKHNSYIAVNCGAIPEGTIDSELFGHEKGSFTGATGARKGYFEEANGGTIFLDEVGELPLQTQVRLLRVLESGEFIKVGSSQIIKTDARIVAATNVKIEEAISKGKFREDLYYRLNTVPIFLPPLRERKMDIILLFKKFAIDFAEKYRTPFLELSEDAIQYLINYQWKGNIRQLRNIVEQITVVETKRLLTADILSIYLPPSSKELMVLKGGASSSSNQEDFMNEREILYKILFDMRNDLQDLKKLTMELMKNGVSQEVQEENQHLIKRVFGDKKEEVTAKSLPSPIIDMDYEPTVSVNNNDSNDEFEYHELEEISTNEKETLSLHDNEKELIIKALEKYNGKRKYAAEELGISERTLYRKIKQYDL